MKFFFRMGSLYFLKTTDCTNVVEKSAENLKKQLVVKNSPAI